MALNINLIFYNIFVHKNLSPSVSSWSACINSALSFFLIGFTALTRLSHIIVSVPPMTNWKDSSDSWKDSRHSGQLMAALFSWKGLSNLSPGIQYIFFNSKLPKPVCMPQMAGKTPQSWLNKLTTTVTRWWSLQRRWKFHNGQNTDLCLRFQIFFWQTSSGKNSREQFNCYLALFVTQMTQM